jgi:hypothetical protein
VDCSATEEEEEWQKGFSPILFATFNLSVWQKNT